MNQKLEVKLVDMGTDSEEQCRAASLFRLANPNETKFQVLEAMPLQLRRQEGGVGGGQRWNRTLWR